MHRGRALGPPLPTLWAASTLASQPAACSHAMLRAAAAGVTWYVLRKTQSVSTRQVMNVTALLSGVMGGRGRAGNARPTQPANGRVVFTTKVPGVKFDLQSASSFEKLLEGEVNIDSRSAHKLAQAVAALIVCLMMVTVRTGPAEFAPATHAIAAHTPAEGRGSGRAGRSPAACAALV